MLRIQITRTGIGAIGKNGFRQVGRLAIRAAAEHWHTRFMPLHFENIAYRRYNYQRRDKRTDQLKRDKREWPFGENTQAAIGEVKPLVFSGRSRDAAKQQNIKAVATSHEKYRADVVMNAPALNFGAGKRIDMRAELLAVNPQEAHTLEIIFGREWEKQLKARGLSARKTKRIAA